MMSSRKINWVSSIHPANQSFVAAIESRLTTFYAKNTQYYEGIDFSNENWVKKGEAGFAEIAKLCLSANGICEIGCGRANILRHFPELTSKYSGCDFSKELMLDNAFHFPEAKFSPIDIPNQLPYASESFDLVFSVFVLEHCTNPAALLKECSRLLKQRGQLVVLCPEYAESARMPSQRAGFSAGTSRQKLKQGKLFDSLVTLYDNRIRIPSVCRKIKKQAKVSPQFYINLEPVVFEDKFLPDVDAVYLTSKREMMTFLQNKGLSAVPNSTPVSQWEKERRLIFLQMIKN